MKTEHKWLISFILVGFIIRVLLILSSPALFEWDESFHALVAKNMMERPFKPMLRVDPLLSFDYKAWCCNHIWLHKQPLFLWQMALSMKVFGVSVWAMRLPSLLMGLIMIPMVYSIGVNWTNSKKIGLLAAGLCCVHSYQLGLISGRFMLDHNDMAFVFYMTAGIWGLSSYINKPKLKTALLIGLFVGCAILVKWLTALLIFGGWGLYLLLKGKEYFTSKIWHLVAAAFVSIIVAAPWQLYILNTFPEEAKYTYEYNVMHITETLGHDGDYFYHIDKIFLLYGFTGCLFIIPGLYWLYKFNKANIKITISYAAMISMIYVFFSMIVATKMPAFTMPVCSLLYVIIACGIYFMTKKIESLRWFILVISFLFFMQPWVFIKKYLNPSQSEKNRIHNANIYKSLPDSLSSYAIFNLQPYQDIDLMFFKDVNAFTWYPTEEVFNGLIEDGVKMAIFKSHTNQPVPKYMVRNDVYMIDFDLR